MKYKNIKRFLIVILVLIITVVSAGCSKQIKSKKEQHKFDDFMNDLFIQEVQTDSLSLNYSLASPEDYGITETTATLGEFSESQMKENNSIYENYLHRLSSFDYSALSSEQQLTYEIVKNYYEAGLTVDAFTFYQECLGPTTGIQAQLPILLAEYSFYEKDDIEEYLSLLPCVYDYFKNISEFQKEKSKRGLFMNDSVAKRIINQCEAFISSPENNFLITYFNEKVAKFDGLTKEEIAQYQAVNKKAVQQKVIPAYELLIDTLNSLIGTGTNSAGLFYYPEGQSYYENLVRYKTGSNKSMKDIIKMLEKTMNEGVINLTALTMSDLTLIDKYIDFSSFPLTDPEEIILDLKKDIVKDFPEISSVNCEIKYVPEALSEYLSPAMYLVPPIDNYLDNDIYINGNDADTLSMIYTTVAHEGYPGHLYQCVYFREQKPAPIRNVMNFLGYDEGWATYVELYSYHTAGIDENLADFLEINNIVILCMYARADIGIHYEGWTEKTVINYITSFIGDQKIAARIYNTLLEEPAIYLPYAVGCLEIMELRDKAQSELGNQFSAKEFHTFLLDIGPAQFGIIENRLEDWVKEQKK